MATREAENLRVILVFMSTLVLFGALEMCFPEEALCEKVTARVRFSGQVAPSSGIAMVVRDSVLYVQVWEAGTETAFHRLSKAKLHAGEKLALNLGEFQIVATKPGTAYADK